MGKKRLIRRRINHGACEKKAVKHTGVGSLSDYSDGFFLIELLRKMPNMLFKDSTMFSRDQVFVSHFFFCLKFSRSLILPVMVLYSLHLIC